MVVFAASAAGCRARRHRDSGDIRCWFCGCGIDSWVIVVDMICERLEQARSFGCETVDLIQSAELPDMIEQILGEPEVDAAVDAVGFEARGHGPGAGEQPTTVLNAVMTLARASASVGIPGLYVTGDPGGIDEALDDAPQGYRDFDQGAAKKFVLEAPRGRQDVGRCRRNGPWPRHGREMNGECNESKVPLRGAGSNRCRRCFGPRGHAVVVGAGRGA